MNRQYLQTLLNNWRNQAGQGIHAAGEWLRHARTQDVDVSKLKGSFSRVGQRLRQMQQRDFTLILSDLRPWLRQHRRKLSLYLGVPVTALLLLLLIHQQTTRLDHALALRPAQKTAIESLIQDSKATGSTDITPTLTDTEIETLRVILQNRGISPNILRLNLDQGGSVEFQTDQASFGQWVAFLEEVARRWHLFPTQLTIKATDSPEIVSIRAVLQQNSGVSP
jgi:type II secretory pathway component PulM